MKIKRQIDGFSLIELLVVVGILAIVSALLLANISSGRERARDAVRKSDFESLKKALRIYYNDFQQYPEGSGDEIEGCDDGNEVCTWGGVFSANSSEYMKRLPLDPVNSGINVYSYTQTNGGEGFLLETYLENAGDESDGASQLRCGVINNVSNKTPQLYVVCEK